MKCNNCGYEIEKPNLKTCPLCGCRITPAAQPSETPAEEEERVTVPPQTSLLDEEESGETFELEIADDGEFSFEESSVYPGQQPVEPEAPAMQRQTPEPSPGYSAPEPPTAEPVYPVRPSVNQSQESRIIPEDPDQYLENGSYQPYPDEPEDETGYDDLSSPQSSEKSSGSWVAIVAAAIGGLLIGSLLYFSI